MLSDVILEAAGGLGPSGEETRELEPKTSPKAVSGVGPRGRRKISPEYETGTCVLL